MTESRVVTAHGIAAHSDLGENATQRLQKAMEHAVLQANQEGISNSEENASLIRRRMRVAHQTELMAITQEIHHRSVIEAETDYRERIADMTRAHNQHLANMEQAFRTEMATIQATIDEVK